ncbi:MAG: RNA-metabolising metallo-beta-lactamase [Parcubacteria group bacterium GW2011_GWD2_38_12]|nr:MAG: RNA-metabolising metallo-beta-lactamase [Parcubacteria group bacterium GW2011_GWC2_36_17]KKQ42759.1 MAG: RNA-metabolising metallo-beta-lactamase [Parcubacteria group bacterium GW2011_GWE2_37_8]KKQ52938.1 MAG: RNA-metabolising metallo-beta-lactamase [Parcubacteria group bacterium GW2011_GWD2_38_12]KKQ59143.1 MAG: RNA-metabolising metallo-beta-lactamase [Parcubacteria group bacterium GW2011_GWC1_38_17]KKQ59756.1 MAG: RNA-metabolising metallo-beta-lactamase [Parcubacteria group bacterium G
MEEQEKKTSHTPIRRAYPGQRHTGRRYGQGQRKYSPPGFSAGFGRKDVSLGQAGQIQPKRDLQKTVPERSRFAGSRPPLQSRDGQRRPAYAGRPTRTGESAGETRQTESKRSGRSRMRPQQMRFHPSIPREGEFAFQEMPTFPIDIANENLKIVPLGGFGEVGRNMMVLEYKDDIIIVDVGLRFREEDMPGVDFIIPNISYLKGKEKNIRGIFITHGHFDHIGAIPYLIEKLGNPPIFATPLSRGIILKRQEEFPNLLKLEIHPIDKSKIEPISLGHFTVEAYHINHNIPDAIGLAIHTPVGTVIHTCDFKFDFTPVGDYPTDLNVFSKFGEKGILALLSDSTGVEQAGSTLSESVIMKNLDEVFQNTQGRLIVSTFSSLLSRVQQIIMLAEAHGRKVAIEGYSMKSNVEIARELGYLKIQKGTIIDIKDIDEYPHNKAVIICTGAQGESSAALMRIVNREHRFVRLHKNDTVVFSSSVVPGNERTVQFLKDLIARQGAKIFHYKMMDIHASGHAQVEDLKMMISLIKPRYFVPIHGQFYMLQLHAELAKGLGYTDENIGLIENGDILELNPSKINIIKQVVPANYVMVDGLGVGDIGEVVLRDRRMLAEDGMFVIIAVIDSKTGKVRGNPDIISRGFVYLREARELLSEVRKRAKYIVEKSASRADAEANYEYVKDNIRDKIGQYLFQQTQRRPMILPVIIEI